MAKNTQSSAVFIEAGDSRPGTGILCNDSSGLCLGNEGATLPNPGAYTNLVKLASQLPHTTPEDPLITIETLSFAILAKSYDGHAVAFMVPSTHPGANPSSATAASDSAAEPETEGSETQV